MIIQSLLDTDFYKFTISQYAWKYHRDVDVRFSLINRNESMKLDIIDEDKWKKEFKNLQHLTFDEQEIEYLHSLRIFEEEYLMELCEFSLSDVLVSDDKHKNVLSQGYWWKATLAETFVLSIINELYLKSFNKYFKTDIFQMHEQSCISNIVTKFDILRNSLDDKPRVFDFGTRRRASYYAQEYATKYMTMGAYYGGSSNVFISRMYGTDPVGTYAHEIPMITGALYIDYGKETSWMKQQEVLLNWQELYPESSLILLPDTYGHKNFLERVMTKSLAETWNGFRHDSGDPDEFANTIIEYYKSLDIDPKEKYIVFSDGLELNDIIRLYRKFHNQINVKFGWGTNLTNDGLLHPLSIVYKPAFLVHDGIIHHTVKLSDEKGKESPKEYPKTIQKYKEIFDHE